VRIFYGSFIFTAIGMALAMYWGFTKGGMAGALTAAFTTIVLSLMEVSLSFDNAVVNAKILKTMSERWQKIFLTWGMLIAVFGMRLVFPVAIVSITANLGMFDVIDIALNNPSAYEGYLTQSHTAISAFGGMFLLLVFLSFLFDTSKEVHWISIIEERLIKVGQLKSAEIITAMVVLLMMYTLAPLEKQLTALVSGLAGILTFGLVNGLADLMESAGASHENANATADAVKTGGIMTFLYLEVLDASFSFDGVIGAFAITKDIVIIMIGLGIGAMFVRSMTIYLVKRGTLSEFVYLEHGAHYAIGALAFIMLLSMKVHVHELITGTTGIVLILLALGSSILKNRKDAGQLSK
jgi:hypothetical protein